MARLRQCIHNTERAKLDDASIASTAVKTLVQAVLLRGTFYQSHPNISSVTGDTRTRPPELGTPCDTFIKREHAAAARYGRLKQADKASVRQRRRSQQMQVPESDTSMFLTMKPSAESMRKQLPRLHTTFFSGPAPVLMCSTDSDCVMNIVGQSPLSKARTVSKVPNHPFMKMGKVYAYVLEQYLEVCCQHSAFAGPSNAIAQAISILRRFVPEQRSNCRRASSMAWSIDTPARDDILDSGFLYSDNHRVGSGGVITEPRGRREFRDGHWIKL